MARLAPVVMERASQHFTQRGNHRHTVFFRNDGYRRAALASMERN